MSGRFIATAAILSAVALGACSRDELAEPTQSVTSGLQTVVVNAASVHAETSFDGVIEAVNQATVAAQTSGRVLELPYDVGDYVERGSVIVRLRETEQRARADSAAAALTDARARLAEAQLAHDRIKDVFSKGMVAKAAYDKALADLQSARARVDAAASAFQEAKEGLEYTTIRAPYSGIVVARHIEVGEIAAVGKPLMTGLSLEELRAVVDIPQAHIGPLRKHRSARVVLPNGESVLAEKLRLPPAADPSTQSFRVQVTLPQGDHGVFPGTLVKVAFVTGAEQQLLAPAKAVVRRGEITGVYVENERGLVSFRYVRIGTPTADGMIPIVAGLKGGEKIALDPIAAGIAYKKQASSA
jgi:RND family efflux transporter MFP subunit